MACPSDNNSGLVKLVGPIQDFTLKSISYNSFPVHLSISPRTTVPSLLGNQIDDITVHTCSYKGKTYQLMSIQICEVTHSGYQLPGQSISPRAELILSFSPKSGGNMEDVSLKGILMCLPIYPTSETIRGQYLHQLVSEPANATAVSTIESLFRAGKDGITQTSLAYTTCFETENKTKNLTSHGLYVIVFPNGIEIQSSAWEQLASRIGTLKKYQTPTAIRGTDPTLLTYTMASGKKIKNLVSPEGYLYQTTIETASTQFTNRFEYFKQAPTAKSTLDKKTYKTTQYKCMPFDQLRNLQSPNDIKNSYVIPDGMSLGNLLETQKKVAEEQKKGDVQTMTLSTGQIETIIGASVGALVVGVLAFYLSNRLSSPNK